MSRYPNRNPESSMEIINESTERYIQTRELIKQESEKKRRKQLQEEPNLPEYENILHQLINQYISNEIRNNKNQFGWRPNVDSVYLCYDYIFGMVNNTAGDRPAINPLINPAFREWFNKTGVGDVRYYISNEFIIFNEVRKSRTN